MPAAEEIAAWLDALLRTAEIPDYPGALNGLQLASRGTIETVACAVDYSTATVAEAARTGADMLLVHHGMFWGGAEPLRGPTFDRLTTLIENDIAVYSSHLPLDLHPDLGNNVLLARHLGLSVESGFARFKGVDIGVSGPADISTSDLFAAAANFAAAFRGTAIATPFDSTRRTRHWGICTGAGASSDTIREALEREIDTMIVGEGPHHTAVTARDRGIVIIYAGHYATETLGVRALGERLADTFGLTSHFIDVPTGL